MKLTNTANASQQSVFHSSKICTKLCIISSQDPSQRALNTEEEKVCLSERSILLLAATLNAAGKDCYPFGGKNIMTRM